MGLRSKQFQFVECIGNLIRYAYGRGYELTLGDGYRDPRVFGVFGEKKAYAAASSVHKVRLAQDFNLFVNDIWIQADHPAWDDLGQYWKSLHQDARWGGDFKSKDLNHFSFEYQGKM